MKDNVKQRLIKYIESKNISKNKFEVICGFSKRYVSNISVSIQPDKIKIISLHFPDLNTGWLLTGEGEMLKKETNQKNENNGDELIQPSNSIIMSREVFDLVLSQQKTIQLQQETIIQLTRQIQRGADVPKEDGAVAAG